LNNLAIETDRLTKFYGHQRGIEDLSISINRGEVFGLLGPNGAGKTTTIRLLLCLIKPTNGTIKLLGKDVNYGTTEILEEIGYLPSDFVTYQDMTVGQILRYFNHLRSKPFISLSELCEQFNLQLDRRVRELSRGNRQKIGIVQAFMHDPDLIILDEPSTGLDPLLQKEFQQLVKKRKAAGATQFISSHLLSEVETLCDRIGIIKDGKLVTVETVSSLKTRSVQNIEITFFEDVEVDEFERINGVSNVIKEDKDIRLTVVGEMDTVIKVISRHRVLKIRSTEPSLEEIFLRYYK